MRVISVFLAVLSVVAGLLVLELALASDAIESEDVKADAQEAAASCVVIHEKNKDDKHKNVTCFENIGLERSAFESGVCRWNTDKQASEHIDTITQFVAQCPASYRASCDRLVIGPAVTAPVKIFLYDKSDDVLARARKHCLGGGGNWKVNESASE